MSELVTVVETATSSAYDFVLTPGGGVGRSLIIALNGVGLKTAPYRTLFVSVRGSDS